MPHLTTDPRAKKKPLVYRERIGFMTKGYGWIDVPLSWGPTAGSESDSGLCASVHLYVCLLAERPILSGYAYMLPLQLTATCWAYFYGCLLP